MLTADNERMRVVIDSERDTMELRKVDACWYTEDLAEIEIEALIPLAGTNVASSAVPSDNYCRARLQIISSRRDPHNPLH